MIDQKRLKELLHYDPETGHFTWKVSRGRANARGVAGYSDTNGYVLIKIDGKNYSAHRLAFLYIEGAFPQCEVDHINHDRADNRWANLRPVTRDQNMRNIPRYKNNTSGITGVRWIVEMQKWRAQISVNGKYHHLGLFEDFNEAVERRKLAEKEHGFHPNHGDEQ
jgi:hypothetical protein